MGEESVRISPRIPTCSHVLGSQLSQLEQRITHPFGRGEAKINLLLDNLLLDNLTL